MKRGRRAANESRAAEIRAKLLVWKQAPEPGRMSLRALATRIGTSHQLLSFYLRQWDKWQSREYRRRAREIRAHAKAERRPLTPGEEAQIVAYERAGFRSMIDSVVGDTLRQLWKQVKLGKLSGLQVKMAKLLARKGWREAQEILNVHFQRANNLPGTPTGPAKSFRTTTGVAGNSPKTVPYAIA